MTFQESINIHKQLLCYFFYGFYSIQRNIDNFSLLIIMIGLSVFIFMFL